MQIRVIEIGAVESVNKGRNTWQQITVKYRGDKGEQSRSIKSFEKDVFNAFKQEIKPGDTVDVKIVKEGDFWNWKEAKVVEGGSDNQAETSAQKGSSNTGTTGSKKVGDWETSAERAARQRYIVRQSSISSAIEYFSNRGFDGVGIAEILNVAETFERHVFGEKAAETPIAGGPAKRGRPAKQTESEEVE